MAASRCTHYAVKMRRYRVVRHFAFCWLALLFVPFVHAQKTQADLNARLLNKPLFLREKWVNDKLKFDAQGQLLGKSDRVVFTLAGIDVTKVKLSSGQLKISGRRVGVIFEHDVPRRVALDDMSLEIAAPADGDYTQALDAIFVDDLAHMRPFVPSWWQQYLAEHFSSGSPAVNEPKSRARKVGGAVKSPVLLSHSEPRFNAIARKLKYSGTTLISMTIDTDGAPKNLRVVRPIGLGLDDQAIAAAAQYRFRPATENDLPVAVQVNVEVNFQID